MSYQSEINEALEAARASGCTEPYPYAAGMLAQRLSDLRGRFQAGESLLEQAHQEFKELEETDECRCAQLIDPEPDEVCGPCQAQDLRHRIKSHLNINQILFRK